MSIKAGTKCVVNGCNNTVDGNSDLTFHRFPTHRPDLAEKWLKIVNREGFVPVRTMVVCGEHFPEESFQMRAGRKILKANTVPSLPGTPKSLVSITNDVSNSTSETHIYLPDHTLEASEETQQSDGGEINSEETGNFNSEDVVQETIQMQDENRLEAETNSTVFMIHSYAHLNEDGDDLKQKIEELEMQNKKLKEQLRMEREKNVQLKKQTVTLDVNQDDKKTKMSIAYIRF